MTAGFVVYYLRDPTEDAWLDGHNAVEWMSAELFEKNNSSPHEWEFRSVVVNRSEYWLSQIAIDISVDSCKMKWSGCTEIAALHDVRFDLTLPPSESIEVKAYIYFQVDDLADSLKWSFITRGVRPLRASR